MSKDLTDNPTKQHQTSPNESRAQDHSGLVAGTLSKNYVTFYLGSALAGMSRTVIGFPVEHPIDSIKTQWQARPHLKNELAIVKEIYSTKGLKGFYAGSIPNLSRCLLKNTYRYPLMVGLPRFYAQNMPNAIREREHLMKLMTGVSIGLVEASLTCPVERVKVYFMTTTDTKLSYREFFLSLRGRVRKELFRGFTPLFVRQSISWSVFLQTDLAIKGWLRRIYGISQSEQIPTKLLVPASFLVALINTAIVMPLDCVKTHMEKVDPTSTYLQTFRNIYKQGGGATAFFTGYRLRFMLHLTNALFAVNFLEKLEHIAKQMRKQ